MEGLHVRFGTILKSISLTAALIQIPPSTAFPYNPGSPRQGRPFPIPDLILPRPPGIANEIPDGQVQVQYATNTQQWSTSSTSSGLTARDVSTTSFNIVSTKGLDLATSLWTPSLPDSSLTSLTSFQVQTALSTTEITSATGSVITSLLPSNQPTLQPFIPSTSLQNATNPLSLVDTATLSDVQPTQTSIVTALSASNIFGPIASDSPIDLVGKRDDHPVQRTGIQIQHRKLQTNKFYSAFYLNKQVSPVYTFPYSVSWAKGQGQVQSWGLAISHVEPGQWGQAPGQPGKDGGKWAFFGAPVGVQNIVLSATQLAVDQNAQNSSLKDPGFTTDTLEWGSVQANLFPPGWQTPVISFPLVQGSCFVTGEYHWAQPLIQSGVGITTLKYIGAMSDTSNRTFKYRATMRDQTSWLIYITRDDPTYEVHRCDLDSTGTAVNCHSGFNGIIQVAKVPTSGSKSNPDADAASLEAIYDSSAGTYPTGLNITGSVNDAVGTYALSWTTSGIATKELLMFALPHHVSSFASETATGLTYLQMRTTTKGMATAARGASWTMVEDDLPIDMGFPPWTPMQKSVKILSTDALSAIGSAGAAELQQNMTKQTDVGSVYYDGKALAKFAALCYTIHDIVGNETLALTGLLLLEEAFAQHVNNLQTWALTYDTQWGGVVSEAAYLTGNALDDFGNTYYNDHHFHYGYFVYAAAVIGHLDPTWLTNGTNKAWVNMLVRDYANSDVDDDFFPFSRSFDWYHGHSWAAGLFDSADGKNQESSSEDTMASYAIKQWGHVINDKAMEARGNLMLAIQKKSLANNYLFTDDNQVQPAEYIGNKAAGIVFENKMDHTTYFGAQREFVQGIHMIPIMPFSTYIRSAALVEQEWATYFGNDGYIDTVQGGWRGLLWANRAISGPEAARDSWAFFNNASLDPSLLDGGASQTWYLTWAAALCDGPIYTNGGAGGN